MIRFRSSRSLNIDPDCLRAILALRQIRHPLSVKEKEERAILLKEKVCNIPYEMDARIDPDLKIALVKCPQKKKSIGRIQWIYDAVCPEIYDLIKEKFDCSTVVVEQNSSATNVLHLAYAGAGIGEYYVDETYLHSDLTKWHLNELLTHKYSEVRNAALFVEKHGTLRPRCS